MAIREHHAFGATGHLGLLWGLLAAEVFARPKVKRSQKLSSLSARTRLWEAEESLSCDAEHLRSGRGRKGVFPKLSKAPWTGHPRFWHHGWGHSESDRLCWLFGLCLGSQGTSVPILNLLHSARENCSLWVRYIRMAGSRFLLKWIA